MEGILSKHKMFNPADMWMGRQSSGRFDPSGDRQAKSLFQEKSWNSDLPARETDDLRAAGTEHSEITDSQTEIIETLDESQDDPDLEDAKITVGELRDRLEESRLQGFEQAKQELAEAFDGKIFEMSQQVQALLAKAELVSEVTDDVSLSLARLSLKVGEELARGQLESSTESIKRFIQNSLKLSEQTLESSARIRLPLEWETIVPSLDLKTHFPNFSFHFDAKLRPGDLELDFGGEGFEDFMEDRIAHLATQIQAIEEANDETDLPSQESGSIDLADLEEDSVEGDEETRE